MYFNHKIKYAFILYLLIVFFYLLHNIWFSLFNFFNVKKKFK